MHFSDTDSIVTSSDLFYKRLSGTYALRSGITLIPVNTEGVMGAGIAKLFAKMYPTANYGYRRLCKERQFQEGRVLLFIPFDPSENSFNRNILDTHSCAVLFPTKTVWRMPSTVKLIERSFEAFKYLLGYEGVNRLTNSVRVHTPFLGAGLGNLSRTESVKLIVENLENANVNVLLHTDKQKMLERDFKRNDDRLDKPVFKLACDAGWVMENIEF